MILDGIQASSIKGLKDDSKAFVHPVQKPIRLIRGRSRGLGDYLALD